MSFLVLIAIMLGTIVAVGLLAWAATYIALLIVHVGGAVARWLWQRGGTYGR